MTRGRRKVTWQPLEAEGLTLRQTLGAEGPTLRQPLGAEGPTLCARNQGQ